MERPPAAGKPVDPATRLSELLAQSLEELTRPFDAPRPGAHPSRSVAPDAEAPPPAAPQPAAPQVAAAPPGPSQTVTVRPPAPAAEPAPQPSPEQARIDADKALAELEAELFAAAKQVDRDASIPHTEDHGSEHPDVLTGDQADKHLDEFEKALLEPLPPLGASDHKPGEETDAASSDATPPLAPEAPATEADASGVIAKVRRLMLISMAVTVIAVGSVFGFIGYRVFKGEGTVEKRVDKLPTPAIPSEVTLSLPRGAKIIQSAVSNDRLIMTLDVDGKVEVRTFDVKTLAPAGRLNFSATP